MHDVTEDERFGCGVPGNGSAIEPMSEDEVDAVYDEYDQFVRHRNGKTTKKLHIPSGGSDPDGPRPLCDRAEKHDDVRWKADDTAIWPKGYVDVCLYCTARWREQRDD
jgi:hypothetical protein